MQYDPIFFHSCIISTKPHYLSGLWASLVAFDIYVFIMTFLNAAERPRRVETEIVSALNRDGVMYFFVRIVNSPSRPLMLMILRFYSVCLFFIFLLNSTI